MSEMSLLSRLIRSIEFVREISTAAGSRLIPIIASQLALIIEGFVRESFNLESPMFEMSLSSRLIRSIELVRENCPGKYLPLVCPEKYLLKLWG